jgi:hypothetical protein
MELKMGRSYFSGIALPFTGGRTEKEAKDATMNDITLLVAIGIGGGLGVGLLQVHGDALLGGQRQRQRGQRLTEQQGMTPESPNAIATSAHAVG